MKKLMSIVFLVLFALSIAGVSFAAETKTAVEPTKAVKLFSSQNVSVTTIDCTSKDQIVIAAGQGCGNYCQELCHGRSDYSSCYNRCMRNCK